MNFGSIIHDVLRAKYKGCEYVCGETYESLQWLDKVASKPTEQQLLADIEDYKAKQSVYDYAILRQAAYPTIGDQLDMLWHSMDVGEIPKCKEFYDACKAVKDKYPKV